MPELWSNQDRARSLLQKKSAIEGDLEGLFSLEGDLISNIEIIELLKEEDDEDILDEVQGTLLNLYNRASKMETECLFSGEADSKSCFIDIHSGAGGTESNDWAQMLQRMYTRWAEIFHKFSVKIEDSVAGDEVGIKSALLRVDGHRAYGWAKAESGVHRLVRISPFDSNNKRHTTFANINVIPIVDNDINIDIADKDIRIDTYRSSGAGGQHVNTTDSAVRITHLSTNIVVQCQNNRSQHQNKEAAMTMLKSRLYEAELRKREEEAMKEREGKSSIGWGNHIRSYVFYPYQMVKDVRTGHESSNVQNVMDGNLDSFIKSTLSSRAN